MKRFVFSILVALTIGTGLTACSSPHRAYNVGVCVDPTTQDRVPDSYCQTNTAWWYYVPYGFRVPAYYGLMPSYSPNNYTRPAGQVHLGGAPASGGAVPKFKSGNITVKPPAAPKVNAPKVNQPKVNNPAPKVNVPKFNAPKYNAPPRVGSIGGGRK